MTVYVVLAEHPDHGTEVLKALKHKPDGEEMQKILEQHLKDRFVSELSREDLDRELASYDELIFCEVGLDD